MKTEEIELIRRYIRAPNGPAGEKMSDSFRKTLKELDLGTLNVAGAYVWSFSILLSLIEVEKLNALSEYEQQMMAACGILYDELMNQHKTTLEKIK